MLGRSGWILIRIYVLSEYIWISVLSEYIRILPFILSGYLKDPGLRSNTNDKRFFIISVDIIYTIFNNEKTRYYLYYFYYFRKIAAIFLYLSYLRELFTIDPIFFFFFDYALSKYKMTLIFIRCLSNDDGQFYRKFRK